MQNYYFAMPSHGAVRHPSSHSVLYYHIHSLIAVLRLQDTYLQSEKANDHCRMSYRGSKLGTIVTRGNSWMVRGLNSVQPSVQVPHSPSASFVLQIAVYCGSRGRSSWNDRCMHKRHGGHEATETDSFQFSFRVTPLLAPLEFQHIHLQLLVPTGYWLPMRHAIRVFA